MSASWSRSHTLGIKQKVFFWRIDGNGNIFIKRKFKRARFPRIDKISYSYLDRLCKFMQDMEWKDLANGASKLYKGNEKDGIGKFLYRLRPEVPYAQLSSQLGAIFYHAEVWKWNEQKRGMRFLLLSEDWQQKTMYYFLLSLNPENESIFLNNFSKHSRIDTGRQEVRDKTPTKVEQMQLSAFFDY